MLPTKVKQGKFIECISPDEGIFRETCKSQNIIYYISHSISPTPQFNVGIIQILIKCLSTIFSAEFNKKNPHLSVQLKYHTFQEGLNGGGGVWYSLNI